MAQSQATTVEEYLAELPADRAETLEAVRKVILEHLPEGYVETMQYGMIGYSVPLEMYPVTYNGQPLEYAALASQKRYKSLYLMNVYGNPDTDQWFIQGYKASGKKLDMGKSCVRFKKLDELPLDLIGQVIARTPMTEFTSIYKASRKKQ